MDNWIHDLARLAASDTPAVLVTVAAARGSVPRAPGAHMVVSADATAGTIGGGQLEYRAIDIARGLLSSGTSGPRLVRFPLGASVGQCCGGVVHLSFEPLGTHDRAWIEEGLALARANRPWGRLAPLDGAPGAAKVFSAENCADLPLADVAENARALLQGAGGATIVASPETTGSTRWLVDVAVPPALHVVLFGAGHVGRAMVETFGRLPMRVTWVDTRDDEFLAALPDNVATRCTDIPAAEVAEAPADAIFLVLTHSHALDFDLTRAILDRGDFRFLGLIGSRSKRTSFERRLRARGYDDSRIARITCPIGIGGVTGKEPEVIAIAVAAEILRLRGAAAGALTGSVRRYHSPVEPDNTSRAA